MPRGGKRPGSGRVAGEPTQMMRIPRSVVTELKDFLAQRKELQLSPVDALPPGVEVWKADPNPSVCLRPLASHHVQAGFPSPADDYIEKTLDLNAFLVEDPECTYFYRVTGMSMVNAGIYPGDVLVVSRAPTPKNDDIVIAILDGELTVKRLYKDGDRITLVAENKDFPPIRVREGQELQIWGVVKHTIRSFGK